MQDLGAAGITCALSETAAAAGLGVEGDLDRVPLREADMEPWEICMSESQERMLAAVAPDRIEHVARVCRKWGLDASVVARYTEGGRLVIKAHGDDVGDVPAQGLADGPLYERPVMQADRRELHPLDPFELTWPGPDEILMRLLSSPSIPSKPWVRR